MGRNIHLFPSYELINRVSRTASSELQDKQAFYLIWIYKIFSHISIPHMRDQINIVSFQPKNLKRKFVCIGQKLNVAVSQGS